MSFSFYFLGFFFFCKPNPMITSTPRNIEETNDSESSHPSSMNNNNFNEDELLKESFLKIREQYENRLQSVSNQFVSTLNSLQSDNVISLLKQVYNYPISVLFSLISNKPKKDLFCFITYLFIFIFYRTIPPHDPNLVCLNLFVRVPSETKINAINK